MINGIFFLRRLACAVPSRSRLGREADAERAILQRSDFGQDVRIFDQLDGRHATMVLLQSVLGRIGDAIVGHGSHADENIGDRGTSITAACISSALFTLLRCTPDWSRNELARKPA